MNVKYYKKYIEKLINSNPTYIKIRRTRSTDDGFGGTEESAVTLRPQKVTFYEARAQREVVSDKGITSYYSSNVVKMLAKSGADIKCGDIFKSGGQTFKVAFLQPYLDVCYQAELEVIKP